jgi:hypothetical protein
MPIAPDRTDPRLAVLHGAVDAGGRGVFGILLQKR